MSAGSSSKAWRRDVSNNGPGDVFQYPPAQSVCFCGLAVHVKTSWTDINPGCRFVSCPNRAAGRCGYFEWCEPPLCARAREVIPGLVARIKELEKKLDGKKKKDACSFRHHECVGVAGLLAAVIVMFIIISTLY